MELQDCWLTPTVSEKSFFFEAVGRSSVAQSFGVRWTPEWLAPFAAPRDRAGVKFAAALAFVSLAAVSLAEKSRHPG
jgi:hypothetical protein